MKAIPFVCLLLLLSAVAALHAKVPPEDVVFIQVLADPIKVRPVGDAGYPDCSMTRKKQEIIWSRSASSEIALIRAADEPFKSKPIPEYAKWARLVVDAFAPDETCSKPFYVSGHPVTCIEVEGGRSECRVYNPLEVLERRRKARIEQWKMLRERGDVSLMTFRK